ncbi:hypothetical protein [Neomicrococcus lactis]|nr:hypothetical protein [Neomicrococcus lactis]
MKWAAGEKRAWLGERGVSFFPVLGWAERGERGEATSREVASTNGYA